MLAPLIYTSPLNAIPQHHREASQSKWAYDIILNTFPFTWPPPLTFPSLPYIYLLSTRKEKWITEQAQGP